MLEIGQTDPEEVNHDEHPPRLNTGTPLSSYSRRLTLLAIVTAALAGGYLLFKPTLKISPPAQSSRVETGTPDQAVPIPAAQMQLIQPASEPPLRPEPPLASGENQGIVLRLKAVSDGRIHITIDGSVSQDYDLVTGDLVEWKAEYTFILDLDNAASVEGELDGVKLGSFGEQGRAAHLVLKADGLHKE